MATQYTEKDAARETGVSEKHAVGAHHQAREDARSSGDLKSARESSERAQAVRELASYADRQ